MAIHQRHGDRIVYVWRFGLTPAWIDRADNRFAEFVNKLTGKLGLRRHYFLPGAD